MKKILLISLILFANYSFSQIVGYENINPSKMPALKKSGTSQVGFKFDPISSISVFDDTLLSNRTPKIIDNIQPDQAVNTRSAGGAALFKMIAPSVVLIIGKNAIGSGTVIDSSGTILTNYHVVEGATEVGIVIKPSSDIQKVSTTGSSLIRAKVIKVDEVTDLALIQPVVAINVNPVKLGDASDINIGMDIHAIGHPRGEYWSYTKGVVSQYRNDYQWLRHRANVIQTQTPINPGNSGGPLFSDQGLLLGVNAFVDKGAQGLNYAISVDDVKTFLAMPNSRYLPSKKVDKASTKKKCEMKETYSGKTTDGTGEIVGWDTKCTGKTDMTITVPYDSKELVVGELDRNLDGKADVIIFSENKSDGIKWEFSFWDNNFDGKWDMVGYHENGDIKPVRYESFATFKKKMASK